MKTLEKILLVLCAVFLVTFLITLKPLRDMNTCVEDSGKQLYSDEMRKATQAQDKLRACELGKENVQTLLVCLDGAKKNSITRLTFSFIELSKPEFSDDYYKDVHNQACNEYPETLL